MATGLLLQSECRWRNGDGSTGGEVSGVIAA
jgi:hypothetical protein